MVEVEASPIGDDIIPNCSLREYYVPIAWLWEEMGKGARENFCQGSTDAK